MTADLLRRIATAGLADGPTGEQPEPLDDATFADLLALAGEQRLIGLFERAAHDGTIALHHEQHARLAATHELHLAVCLRLEALLVAVVRLLDDHGIEARVLKGPAVARRAYERIEDRTFGDIDLLVRGADWDRAAAVLQAHGCVRRFQDPRPGFTAQFGKGGCFVAPSGYEIDLHRTFVAGPFGLGFDPDRLFDTSASIVVADTTIATLDDATLVVHAAVHAVLGSRPPRWVPVRDVAQLLAAGVAPEAVVDAAGALGLRVPLAVAVDVVAARLGPAAVAPLMPWAATVVADRRERRALAAYTATSRRYARQAVAAVGAIPDVRARARYVRSLALPDREYLAARDGSVGRRLRRGVGVVRRHRSSS